MGESRRTLGEVGPALIAIGALLILGILAMFNPLLAVTVPLGIGFLVCMFRPSIGIYVLMALLFFVPVTINAGWPGQTTTYVFFAALALALGGRLSRAMTGKQSLADSSAILLLLLPIVLVGFIHGTAVGAWLTATRPLIVLVVVAWHVRAEVRLAPERLRSVAVMLAWAAPALLLLAAYQRIAGSWPVLDEFATSKSYTSRGDPSRTAAIMGHPILYGAYCMVTAVIVAALRPKWWKWLLAAALLGLVLSGARSAWIGTAAALLVLLAMHRPRITFWGWYSALLLACATLLAMIFYPQVLNDLVDTAAGRLENLTQSSSALARNLRVDIAWYQISGSGESWWWGLGPGALVEYFSGVQISDNLAATFDNSYLSLWYEYGVVTLAAFAVVALCAIFRRGSSVGRLLMLAIVTQICFFDFYQWPLMIGAIALAAGLRQQEKMPAHQEQVSVSRPQTTPLRPVRTRSAST
jgi:hypothetical protein